MKITQVTVGSQTMRAGSRIEFKYKGIQRRGLVTEIRLSKKDRYNVLCLTAKGYRTFHAFDMTNVLSL